MARREKDSETRNVGMRIRMRFTLLMSGSLAVVMAIAGYFLWRGSTTLAHNVQESTITAAALVTAQAAEVENEEYTLQARIAALKGVERMLGSEDVKLAEVRTDLIGQISRLEVQRGELGSFWKQEGSDAAKLEGGKVLRAPISFGKDGLNGMIYRVDKLDKRPYHLLVPAAAAPPDKALLGLIIGSVITVILVGAAVSVFVAGQVSGPLEEIVDDIRHISTGDLNHRTRSQGAGEIKLLARSIDRMTRNLAEAQENELALSIQSRELEVAAEVREALLPQTTPELEGYTFGAAHLGSNALWGDFHDFLEVGEGDARRVGLLVCNVSGKGLPGALVGATARAYLRSALASTSDVKAALQSVNRDLARDVKRGMYVSALYVVIDPVEAIVTVACAGHKMPLLRFTGEDGKMRTIQPEGIALAFDKGPIFDSRLDLTQHPIEPGDRLVLVNSGAAEIQNAEGKELGDKQLYRQIMKYGALPSEAFLDKLRAVFEVYSKGADLPRDISIVTVTREA